MNRRSILKAIIGAPLAPLVPVAPLPTRFGSHVWKPELTPLDDLFIAEGKRIYDNLLSFARQGTCFKLK